MDSTAALYPVHEGSNCAAIIITIIIIITETIVSCWSHRYLCNALKCQLHRMLCSHSPSQIFFLFLLFYPSVYLSLLLSPHSLEQVYSSN